MGLGIFLITYNRSVNVANTLSYLADSLLVTYPITVLDNCSTDDTATVCKSFTDRLPHLRVITNNSNIGPDANYMKAIEMSTYDYTWVLCDDDLLDLTDFEDVLSVIEEGSIDLIHVGAHKVDWKWGGRIATPKELLKDNYRFFKFGSFIPGSIVKTKAYTANVMAKAYRNIGNSYAQMMYHFYVYEHDVPMYVSKKQHTVYAALGTAYYGFEQFLFWWMNTCALLKNPADVNKAFFDQFDEVEESWLYGIIYKYYLTNSFYRATIKDFISRYFLPEEKKKFRRLSSTLDKKLLLKEMLGEKYYSAMKKVVKF